MCIPADQFANCAKLSGCHGGISNSNAQHYELRKVAL